MVSNLHQLVSPFSSNERPISLTAHLHSCSQSCLSLHPSYVHVITSPLCTGHTYTTAVPLAGGIRNVFELSSLFFFGYVASAALSIRYGWYGKHRLVLGPNSSRMISTSSILVKQVQVRDEVNKGLTLYGFQKQPELILEANWTMLKDLFVNSYGRQGFSLWLNKGSRIRVAWNVTYDGGVHGGLLMVLIKGEQKFKELQRYSTRYYTGLREAVYTIDEDNSYYIGISNMNPRTVLMTLKVDVSSKMYDTSKATSTCSTTNGLCKLKLKFPSTKYFVLTTPNSDVPSKAWYAEISFIVRLIAYFITLGAVAVILYMIMKHLGACEPERTQDEETTSTETDPILPRKEMPCNYGTTEENPESSLCCGSDDLYDQKICVICYDESRNCFFTPCGHSVACYTCAQRIVEEESKICPICRRLIHKVRRLAYP